MVENQKLEDMLEKYVQSVADQENENVGLKKENIHLKVKSFNLQLYIPRFIHLLFEEDLLL